MPKDRWSKLKKGKKIWFSDSFTFEQYEIIKVYRPNNNETYLVIQNSSDECHADGSEATNTFLIDINNDTFYPDSKHVRELIKCWQRNKTRLRELENELCKYWLAVTDDGDPTEYY